MPKLPSSLTEAIAHDDLGHSMTEGGRPANKLAADAPEVALRVKDAFDLVRACAFNVRRQLGRSLEIDELQGMGGEGLLEAARSYAPELGVPFRAWAYFKIRGAMLDGVRRQSVLPRAAYAKLRALEAAQQARDGQMEDEAASATETAEAADARVANTTASIAMAMAAAFLGAKHGVSDQIKDEAESPEEAVIRSTLMEKVRGAIAKLPENECALMTAYYFEEATLEEAGARLGLSKSWSSRLHARALESVSIEIREQSREKELSED